MKRNVPVKRFQQTVENSLKRETLLRSIGFTSRATDFKRKPVFEKLKDLNIVTKIDEISPLWHTIIKVWPF